MANIVHASIDENGKARGGKAGDQTGREVYVRSFYSKPWNVKLIYNDPSVAAKAADIAVKLANSNIVGYNQDSRNTLYQQLKKNNWNVDAYIKSGVKSNTDCSAFIYACYCCLIPAMRSDANAPTTWTYRSLFTKHGFKAYTTGLTSDSTALKGTIWLNESHHVAMQATNGASVSASSSSPASSTESQSAPGSAGCYPKYTGKSSSLVDSLKAVGEKDTSKASLAAIAKANGISNYSWSASQNTSMLKLLKAGNLKKATSSSASTSSATSTSTKYYSKYTGSSVSIVAGLSAVGEKDTSYTHRKKIALANGISNYSGTAAQNTSMLTKLKSGKLIKA